MDKCLSGHGVCVCVCVYARVCVVVWLCARIDMHTSGCRVK